MHSKKQKRGEGVKSTVEGRGGGTATKASAYRPLHRTFFDPKGREKERKEEKEGREKGREC